MHESIDDVGTIASPFIRNVRLRNEKLVQTYRKLPGLRWWRWRSLQSMRWRR
jgi:hypothetical protein